MPGEPGEALAARSGKGGLGDGPLRPLARHPGRVLLGCDKCPSSRFVGADRLRLGISDQDHITRAHFVVDDGAASEEREGPGHFVGSVPQNEDTVLRREPAISDHHGKHEIGACKIIAVRSSGPIVSIEAGVEGECRGVRMGGEPVLPARDHHRQDLEFDAGLGQLPHHGAAR